MAVDTIFLYHFVDADLKVEIFFEKRWQRKMGALTFTLNRGYRHLCTLLLGVEENFMLNLSGFSLL